MKSTEGPDGEDGTSPTALDTEPRTAVKLPERIVWEIARDVVESGVEAGAMLAPEAQMIDQYGVGRATLREALRILEHLGLILLRPGPGGGPQWIGVDSRQFGKMMTAYLHLSDATFGDVLQARMVLEPVMGRLAAAQARQSSDARLVEFLTNPQPSADLLPAKHHFVVTEFHGLVNSLPHNKVLELLAQSVRHIYADRQHGLTFPEADRQRVLEEHVVIAEHIRAGEVEQAESTMREHMEEFGRYSEERYPGMLADIVDWH